MIHLDTNVAIALLNGRPEGIRSRFDAARAAGDRFALSAVAYHELRYGAAASARPLDNERKLALFLASAAIVVAPFDADDAAEAGRIRATLKRMGLPIGPYDVLIAAQALRARATLITANAREFLRIPSLQVVDWAAAPAS